MLAAKLRLRTCRASGCTEKFRPRSSLQSACSPLCALAVTREAADKKARREHRQAKERIRSKSDWTKLCQQAFNAYVVLRDAGEPCISCGALSVSHHRGWHAGHYRTVGAHPELRFEPLNVHKQCVRCNTHMSGNIVEYRIRLVDRIGQANLDWLEGPHEPANYTIDDLKQIIAQYRAEVREMKRKHD